jgi:hypothetical protein
VPIIGNRWPSETLNSEPTTWDPMELQRISQIIATLAAANGAFPSDKVVDQISKATEALIASSNGQKVFGAVDPVSAEMFFAVGPRFVPEQELTFTLDQVIGESADILTGAGLEYDLYDEEPAAAVRDELLNMGLLEPTPDGDRYDSFSEESRFRSVITVALEDWEMNLCNQPATEKEKQELTEGMNSEQVACLSEQLTEFAGEECTLQKFLSVLTPASGNEFVRKSGLRNETHTNPMRMFLDRLAVLGSKYKG